MNATILPSGALELSLENAEEREELQALHDRGLTDEDIIHRMLEPYWTNGSYAVFNAGDANPFVGLSSAPCIAEDLSVLDDGTREIVGRFWHYADYMLKSMSEELLAHGKIIFDLP